MPNTPVAVRQLMRWVAKNGVPRVAMKRAARRGDLLSEFVLFDEPHTVEGHRLGDQIREAGSFYKGTYGLATARLDVARQVLTSGDFRSVGDPSDAEGVIGRLLRWAGPTGAVEPREPPSLVVSEPPDHTRYRKLLARELSARTVNTLRDDVQAVVARSLNDLARRAADGSPIEMISQFCVLVPLNVICEILGVPDEERAAVRAFGTGGAPSLDPALKWRKFRATEQSLREFDAWLDVHIARLRREPGPDLFSQLVHATEDGGLTNLELKATAGFLLVAGFETAVNMLGNGIALLATNPAELARLRLDVQLWPNAVEEILRLDPPVLYTARAALRDTTVDGASIGEDNQVFTLIAAANRDPEAFPDPTRFDVARPNAREHLAFSAGRHFCVGAALSRMEGEVALRMLFERFGTVELVEGARRRSTRALGGYEILPVRLGCAG